MWQFVKRHPFATYGALTLLLLAATSALKLQLDDGGIGSVVGVTSFILGVVYSVPHEILRSLNGGELFVGHEAISIGVGFLTCLLADYLLSRFRRRNVEKDVSTAA